MNVERAMKRRWNHHHFIKDKVPSKRIVEDILEKAILYTPVKNSVWHHRIDVYGPEWLEEKEALAENAAFMDPYQKRERCNFQVCAPWLIVLRRSFYHYTAPGQENNDKLETAAVMDGMYGYCVSLLANAKGIDASFMKCFGAQPEKPVTTNKIANNTNDFIFMIGLGYYDSSKIDSEYWLSKRIKIAEDNTENPIRKKVRKFLRQCTESSTYLAYRLYRYFRRQQKPKPHEIITWH